MFHSINFFFVLCLILFFFRVWYDSVCGREKEEAAHSYVHLQVWFLFFSNSVEAEGTSVLSLWIQSPSCLLRWPTVHVCRPVMERCWGEWTWKCLTRGVVSLFFPMLYRCCFSLVSKVFLVSPMYIRLQDWHTMH